MTNTTPEIEAVARAIWIVQRRDLDKCDMELEDVGNHYETYDMAHSAIAALPKPEAPNSARVAELEAALRSIIGTYEHSREDAADNAYEMVACARRALNPGKLA